MEWSRAGILQWGAGRGEGERPSGAPQGEGPVRVSDPNVRRAT